MSRAEERRQAREEGGSDMKRFYIVFGAVAAIGIGVVGYNVSAGMFSNAVAAPVPVEGLEDMETLAQMARGVTKGNQDAEVTIVEFGDFQCPACAQFAANVKPQMELAFVENGQAKFVYYDLPITSIHPNAFLAARASRCAEDQGMYWEYHDELFRRQARWAAEVSPTGTFVDYAGTLGLDRSEFSSCLNSDRHAELVTANMQLGQAMRVQSTPTILINYQGDTRQAPGDIRAIAEIIEQMTGGAPGAN